ncbi:MAG TPA: PP2C family protein-serine/threonine phosphatase [Acidobacteriaceae bacterium]|nr:PP2C family protein-serine/threonine phosphatase [Acidobacteriaceae bacterium]
MARKLRWVLAGLALLASAALSAQTASSPHEVAIPLGHSVAPLYHGWKFSIGDSPLDPKTGAPLWAQPGFDDSSWENVDLTPKEGSENPITGTTGYVPGWTTRGHAGYWGYAWYRIRLRIQSAPDTKLALAGPATVDDAYQLFDNGALLGSFGDFGHGRPGIYYGQPMMFPLSPPPGASAIGSVHVIAFRMWMQPQTLFQASGVGGFEAAPSIGESSAVAAQYQVQFDELIRAYLWQPLTVVVFGLLGLIALSLTLADRSDHVYLWIGALLLLISVDAASGVLCVWTVWVHANYDHFSHDILLFSLQYAGWVMVWRSWFRQRRPAWIPWALIPLVLILMASRTIEENFLFVVSQPVHNIAHAVSLLVRFTLSAFLFFIVVKGIREQGLEGWFVLPAVLLAAAAEFTLELQNMGLQASWFPFHVQITLAVASQLLLVVVLAVLLVRRLVLSLRSQRQMALDVKQAQEVQQVILPEATTAIPGFAIESEYRPAREVGGDFFQIIPWPADDSLLVVAGDVAGKGLQAGMLVALLVGAIRSTAELNSEPEFLLQALNRRLLGRGDARATCLALRITRDGNVAVANAGHMPPYLNGSLVEIEGSLPLGVVEDLECSTMQLRMAENDRLLLVSDGVAEAMNAEGELFGFDRVLDLVRSQPAAASIAETAQAFGQRDDISVISVTRIPVAEPAMA